MPEKPPHPERFFIFVRSAGGYVPVKGHRISIPGYEDLDLFVHPNIDFKAGNSVLPYTLTEGKTGARITSESSVRELIEFASGLISNAEFNSAPSLEQRIAARINLNGISPRWQEDK